MLIANTPLASYRIILPAAAMEGERDVAEVLRDTLTRATGVTLEIAADDTPATDYEIVIGKTNRDTDKVVSARAEIQNDGYALVVDGGDLYISATTGRGVVYGMMERDLHGALLLCLVAVGVFCKHLVNLKRIRVGREARLSYLWSRDKETARLKENYGDAADE